MRRVGRKVRYSLRLLFLCPCIRSTEGEVSCIGDADPTLLSQNRTIPPTRLTPPPILLRALSSTSLSAPARPRTEATTSAPPLAVALLFGSPPPALSTTLSPTMAPSRPLRATPPSPTLSAPPSLPTPPTRPVSQICNRLSGRAGAGRGAFERRRRAPRRASFRLLERRRSVRREEGRGGLVG
jgi:hypothetical protein